MPKTPLAPEAPLAPDTDTGATAAEAAALTPAAPALAGLAPPAPALTLWRARTPIEHDGRRYDAGEQLALTPGQAAALAALDAVEFDPGAALPAAL